MTLAHFAERLLDICFRNRNLGLIGTQLLVAFQPDFRQHLKSRLEAQWLTVVKMQVSDARLRYGMQAKPLGFLAEEARNQRFYHVGLDLFRKALANDRRRDVPAPGAS